MNGRSAFGGAPEYGRLEMPRELWATVAGQGFSREQVENAISLAESRGHRGCAENIASISSSKDISTLQVDSFISYDARWPLQ